MKLNKLALSVLSCLFSIFINTESFGYIMSCDGYDVPEEFTFTITNSRCREFARRENLVSNLSTGIVYCKQKNKFKIDQHCDISHQTKHIVLVYKEHKKSAVCTKRVVVFWKERESRYWTILKDKKTSTSCNNHYNR